MDPQSTHTARYSTAAVHFCHVLVQSHMQMYKSFILDSALTKESTQTILFPWKYQAIENRKEFLMPFYLHRQERHLIICSKAEECQVPNHSCHFIEWLCVFVYLCVLCLSAQAWSKNGNPVTDFAHSSQYLVNVFIHCVNKCTVCLVEVEVTGRWLPPTEFEFRFYIERVFTRASQAHLN